ncbi:MAG: hypothetical protein WAZ77_01970 [Candidatus Nitrosopolaris sp.]
MKRRKRYTKKRLTDGVWLAAIAAVQNTDVPEKSDMHFVALTQATRQ